MNFVFVDESYSEPVREDGTFISSMTSLVVPLAAYNAVRVAFYKVLEPFILPKEHTINFMPPELHGAEMLKDQPDDDDRKKLSAFNQIVNLVLDHKLDVYRVAYYITPEWKAMMKGDEVGTSMCWFSTAVVTQPVYENTETAFIMDGFNDETVKKMSIMLRECDIMRAVEKEHGLSLKNTKNIIGEVFYADSRYSAMIQVVDVVSYLRNVNDLSQEGWGFSDFKNEVLAEGKRLDTRMQYDDVVEMNRKRVDRLTGEESKP